MEEGTNIRFYNGVLDAISIEKKLYSKSFEN